MKRNVKALASKISACLFALVLCFSSGAGCFQRAQEVKAASIVVPAVLEYTIGEILYGIFSAAGATTVGVMVGDALFNEDAQLKNFLQDNEIIDPQYIDYDAMADYAERMADEGKSDYAKNVVGPVMGFMPPSDPNSGPNWNWKKALKQTLIGLGMQGFVITSANQALMPYSMALQQWAQPQATYGLSYNDPLLNKIDTEFLLTPFNGVSGGEYFLGYQTYNNFSMKYYVPSDVFAYSINGKDIRFLKQTPGNVNNIPVSYYGGAFDYNGTTSINFYGDKSPYFSTSGFSSGSSDSYIFFGLPSFRSVDDAKLAFSNMDNPELNWNKPIYAPNIVNQDGNVYNINNIYPVIEGDQQMQVPSYDMINNYINNYNNATNQGDVINNYNNFINNLIQDAPVVPDKPVIPDIPDVPVITGVPQPTPPLEDDENGKFLAPDLRDFFPFCIPFDLYDIFKNFSSARAAPKFTFHLKSDLFNFDHPIELDLSSFDGVAQLLRLLELILFVVILAVATRKLIGAGG